MRGKIGPKLWSPELVAELRTRESWTTRDLAPVLGVHRATVCRYLAAGRFQADPGFPDGWHIRTASIVALLGSDVP